MNHRVITGLCFRVSGFQGFRVSGFQSFRVSGFDFVELGYASVQGFRVSV